MPTDLESTAAGRRLIYGIEEQPARLLETVLYGWQHTLVDISPFVLPLAVGTALQLDPAGQAEFINFCLIAMGLATLIQTTIGNRLPIVQGPSATLIGTLAPLAGQLGGGVMWGAAFAGGAAEFAVGASGVLRRLRRLFSPVVTASIVVAIGVLLLQLGVRLAVGSGSVPELAFAGGVIASIVLMRRLFSPGLLATGAVFFSLWLVGLGFGQLAGRVEWELVAARPWLQAPRLFPFGGPFSGWELAAGALAVVLAGYLGSMLESVGDYAATAGVSDRRLTDGDIDRGIAAEGAGCMLATVVGGLPCTSYSQNIGIIATTRVASRRVVQCAGVILLLYGLCPKFGALLVALPRTALGGVLVVVCAMIVHSGWRLLQTTQEPRRELPWLIAIVAAATGLPLLLAGTSFGARLTDTAPLVSIVAGNGVVVAVVLAVVLQLVRGRGPKG